MSPAANSIVKKLLIHESVRRAFDFFVRSSVSLTDAQIELCRIPAPPFGEAQRAEFFRQKLISLGYRNAHLDCEGNCLALKSGRDKNSILVVSAHLDTVFDADTDLTLRREKNRIYAPGIMDDACGLAAILALAEVFQKFNFETEKTILFVGTVGEEGAGNLRGVRHLLTDGEFARNVAAFVSLDGAGVANVVNRALGSRRYRAEIAGVGGHSFLDFGAPNPVHAAARAVSRLTQFPLSPKHRTTFNTGKIVGGTSVNSIPSNAEFEVDLRSDAPEDLKRLDSFFRRAVTHSVADENSARNQKYPPLKLDLKLTGERPSGATPETAPLVRFALEATRAVSVEPHLTVSSTDSNFPMSLGIPAVTLGAGGTGDKMHTLEEWFDPTGREIGLQRALLLILTFAEAKI